MKDYCYTCEKEVSRCWNSESGCCGGGHCNVCMGYDFEDPQIQAMEEADEFLEKELSKPETQDA